MMFTRKLTSLMDKVQITENQFVKEGLKTSTETVSNEGAIKYSTSGNVFVDNFAAISHFKEPRSYADIAKDMELLWSVNPENCVKLILYIRLITRKSVIITNDKEVETLEEVQRGQGLRHESIMRMIWLAINHPKTFSANIRLFIAAGSWKDIITMMSHDLQYNGWKDKKLNWNFLSKVILAGLINPNTTHLVRKYLPTIKTNAKCTTLESQADTIIGRYLAAKINPKMAKENKAKAYKMYRLTKSEGIAHEWQQLISQELYEEINFGKIAGRALSQLVGSKFLENHNLVDKYKEWIISQPVAKYTGYVHELFSPLNAHGGLRAEHIASYKEATINAQFQQLVNIGREGVNSNSRLLVVRDTSGSMSGKVIGCPSISSYNIGKAMALYFSEFLTGHFANSFAEFSNECELKQWIGNTPCDKYVNDRSEAYGGTNFQSVIDLFIKLKNKGVPESDFPNGILCLSDGEFANPLGYTKESANTVSNFNLAIQRLKEAGFSKEYVENFKIILWDIPNNFYRLENKVKFEDFADAPNFFYLSGYDTSVVSFILSGSKLKQKPPKNAEELFKVAMDQELLNKVRIIKPSLKKFKKVMKRKHSNKKLL